MRWATVSQTTGSAPLSPRRTAARPAPAPEPAFVPFPERTLLEAGGLPIAELARLAKREGQSASAIYRVHRWFARRLGSQFRGILTGLRLRADQSEEFWSVYDGDLDLRGAIVFDAFVGGGTSVVEASRCGARVIGLDIDPVATFVTRFELAAAAYSGLPNSAPLLCGEVADAVAPFHQAEDAESGSVEVLHHFWVEVVPCGACGEDIEVHPRYQLAYDTERGVQWAFCRACHAVAEIPLDQAVLACDCGIDTHVEHAPLLNGVVRCPECAATQGLAERGPAVSGPPAWRLFAQEFVVRTRPRPQRRFRRAEADDLVRFHEAETALAAFEHAHGVLAPARAIPAEGRMDGRPLIHGLTHYRQLFNARQLLHLSYLARAIRSLDRLEEKRLFALAFSEHLTTNCMYAGYAFGYRRISPMFSIHGFRHITRPVELNPWLRGIGRGTFPNVLRKLERAVQYAKAPTIVTKGGGRSMSPVPVGPRDGHVAADPAEVVAGHAHAAICTASSANLDGVPDASVDLILTDPPYLDNINYSELSDFYLAWHQTLGVAEPPYDELSRPAPIAENLAATRRGEISLRRYRDELAQIFRECARVLRQVGVCVFTYHHVSARAWECVAHALATSGLVPTAVIPLRGEGQGGLHSYEGTIKWDAVIVCRRAPERPSRDGVVGLPVGASERAAARLRCYEGELAQANDIGFAAPDRLNLYRALLAAEARALPFGSPREDLRRALSSGIPPTGETGPPDGAA